MHRPRRFLVLPLALCALLSSCAEPVAVTGLTDVGPTPTKNTSDDQLRAALDKAISVNQRRVLSAQTNAAWQLVHGLLAYGKQLQVEDRGKVQPALDWLLDGGQMRGWNLRPGDHGLEAILEAGSKEGQGHEDQWIGYFSQCGVKLDDPVVLSGTGQEFTVRDLVTQAQWDVYNGMEATWTLMAVATWLPLDSTWKARDGSEWSIERIVAMEAGQEINDSACGGTHRLCGLSVAVNRYLATGKLLEGAWKDADEVIQECAATAREFQQPDGCFSSNYFIRPGSSRDIGTKIGTTGHTLEFLTYALSDAELQSPWVVRSVTRLCELLEQAEDLSLECGGLYHAAHGLYLYRLRRFGPLPWQKPGAP
jgi:hypothetical protein